ncbi:hypothetical protein JD844_002747 [Phrynosoma platyrhinos]|uniref:Uncharacterized protein n=1 Tax=Phrynosoma platyrhinos TaxID=52577 RepID=A0ABQ7TBX2_PHRPL|nr:hypothetical protein JD844_002747 [Phrynosoma platyrhinos]
MAVAILAIWMTAAVLAVLMAVAILAACMGVAILAPPIGGAILVSLREAETLPIGGLPPSATVPTRVPHRPSPLRDTLKIAENKKAETALKKAHEAISIAIRAATTASVVVRASLQIPKVRVLNDEGTREIELSDDPYDCIRLNVDNVPCIVTLSKFSCLTLCLFLFPCAFQTGKRVGKLLHISLQATLDKEESLGTTRKKVGFLG